MKRLRFSVFLTVTIIANSGTPASAHLLANVSKNATQTPAFLTSAPDQESSLFESSLIKRNCELEQRVQWLKTDLSGPQVFMQDRCCAIEQKLLWRKCGSVGLRSGELQSSSQPITTYNLGMFAFTGSAPTTSDKGRRDLGTSKFSLFGNVSGSSMMGYVRTTSLLLIMHRGTVEDEVVTVFESQIGVAWTCDAHHMQLEVPTS